MATSSISPCAACKFLRRKCIQECVFAPYFPPDQPLKFANVHKVFGASNVAKILNELPTSQREDAVNSLAYEAEARLRDPVYGCVGFISILQQRLKQVQIDLLTAKQELASYMGPATQSGMLPVLTHPGFMQQYPSMQPSLGPVSLQVGQIMPSNMQPILGLQGGGISQEGQHRQQIYEEQHRQLVEAAREQEMLRNINYQQQQQLQLQQHLQQQVQQQQQQQAAADNLMRFNRGFDATGPSDVAGPSGQANPNGFTHLTGPSAAMTPSLALGGSYDNNIYHIQQQQQQPQQEHNQHHHLQQLMPHELLVHQQPQPQPQLQPQPQPHLGDRSEEGPTS